MSLLWCAINPRLRYDWVIRQHPEMGKLIYCTRTVPEMMKCVEEIKRVLFYRYESLEKEGQTDTKVRVVSYVKGL